MRGEGAFSYSTVSKQTVGGYVGTGSVWCGLHKLSSCSKSSAQILLHCLVLQIDMSSIQAEDLDIKAATGD